MNNVQLAIGMVRSRDEGRVHRDVLGSAGAREQPDLCRGVFPGRDQLLPAGQDNVHRGKRGCQTPIALVRDQHDRAGLGDQRVGAGHPDLGLGEHSPQLLPSNAGHLADVFPRHRSTHVGLEQPAHLLPALVDGGHHHVGRRLVCKLDDPLAQIRLDRVHAGRLKRLVEEDLLRHHGLALGEERGAPSPAKLDDVAHGIVGGCRLVHGRPRRLGRRLEARELLCAVAEGLPFRGSQPLALASKGRRRHTERGLGPPVLEGGAACRAIGPLEVEEVPPELAVGQRLAVTLDEWGDRAAHGSASSRNM